MERPCTMIIWRVRPGSESHFQETARRLVDVLLRLPGRPGGVTLVQSMEEPGVFHSIGWFQSEEDLVAMRENPDARQLLDKLVTLCSEFRPTAHRVVHTSADPSASR